MPNPYSHIPAKFINRGVDLRTSADLLPADRYRILENVISATEGELRPRYGTGQVGIQLFSPRGITIEGLDPRDWSSGATQLPSQIHSIAYLLDSIPDAEQGSPSTGVYAIYPSPDGLFNAPLPSIVASPNGLVETGPLVTVTVDTTGFTAITNPLVNGTMRVGDRIILAGAGITGYNGSFDVVEIPNDHQFVYFNHTQGLAASGGGQFYIPLFIVRTYSPISGSPGSVTITGASLALYNGTWEARYQTSSGGYYYTYLWGDVDHYQVVPSGDGNASVLIGTAPILTASELLVAGTTDGRIYDVETALLVDDDYSGYPLTFSSYRMSGTSRPFLIVGDSRKMSKISSGGTRLKLGLAPPSEVATSTVLPYSSFTIDPFTTDNFDYDSSIGPGIWGVNGAHSVGTSFSNGVTTPDGSCLQFTVPYETDEDEKQLVYAIIMQTAIISFGVQEIDMSEIVPGVPATDEDYIHMWVNVDDPDKLLELRIAFDIDANSVADNSYYEYPFWVPNHFIRGDDNHPQFKIGFSRNFYWYSVRPSDLAPTALNDATALQSRREALARSITDTSNFPSGYYPSYVPANPEPAVSSQAQAGLVQWTELKIRRGQFTRVGGDTTRDWSNVRGFALIVIPQPRQQPTVSWSGFYYFGGSGLDSNLGTGYDWRYTYYSSTTQSESNPSDLQDDAPPNGEGQTVERQSVALSALAPDDPQDDRIRFYRRGGTLSDAWRQVVSIPVVSTSATLLTLTRSFGTVTVQTLNEHSFQGGDTIQVSGAIDTSYNGVFTVQSIIDANTFTYVQSTSFPDSSTTGGTAQSAAIDNNSDSDIASARVLQLDNDVPVTTVDDSGETIYGQSLPFIWGPYNGVTMFALGDPYRPGYVYWSKSGNPDAWPSINNVEVTQPSDPLQNGCIWNGQPYVFSKEHRYALMPSIIGAGKTFIPLSVPSGQGLFARWGLCASELTPAMWWVGKDAIYQSTGGPGVSITENDLYPLFHGDTVAGNAPIDFTYEAGIRLSYFDHELYFRFRDVLGATQVWAFHVEKRRWRQASYPFSPLVLYAQPETYNNLLFGGNDGWVYEQDQSVASDSGATIACHVQTGFNDSPDPLAQKEYGSIVLDIDPAGALISGTTLINAGTTGPSLATPVGSGRQQFPSSLNDTYAQSIGLDLQWESTAVVKLYGYELVVRPDELAVVHFEAPASSYGLVGWANLFDGYIGLRSTTGVTLTVVGDGNTTFSVLIPSTSGERLRSYVQFGPNKWKVAQVKLDSTQPFRLYPEDSYLNVQGWGAPGPIEIRPFKV